MRGRSVVVGLFAMAACGAPCAAWGPEGHMIVAELAERRLSDAAKAAVADLPEGRPMAESASWADAVRGQEGYRWSGPLHYVNVPPGATSFVMERDCGEAGCVVSAIEQYRGVLADDSATREAKVEALKFLIHFVGDVHQPLHAMGRDRGGNDTKVTFFARETNLHRVWDEGLIETRRLAWPVYADTLDERITEDQRAAWAELDPGVWATESYQIGVSHAYALPESGVLGEEYVSRNIGLVETRLSQAGVRLAIVLNDVFGVGGRAEPSPVEGAPIEMPESASEP